LENVHFIEERTVQAGTILKRSDGILFFKQAPGRERITVEEIKEQYAVFMDIQKGERSPLLVIAAQLRRLDNEEKMYLSSTVQHFANKMGIVTNSPILIFIFNVLFFVSRPEIPSKVFRSEDEAVSWLKKN